MKNVITVIILMSLSISVNAGYKYIYKDTDGNVVMTNTDPSEDGAIKPFKYPYQVTLEKQRQEERAYQKQLASKPDAAIGMTKSQVRNKTNWGKPNYIKTTTDKYGVREQWVYDDYQYLYFDNGKLVTIQQ